MRVRAVIFDFYYTLLQLGPAPDNAAQLWSELWATTLPGETLVQMPELALRAGRIIDREHAAARERGILHPEIYWPNVVREAVPALSALVPSHLDDFLFRHAQLQRSISLMPGAAETLKGLAARGVPMGIASNAQPYSIRECDFVLQRAHLDRSLFRPDLCFWSFAFGFSKPDPHVFRLLDARLRAEGILSQEILMVGDRLDNDITPARSLGWQTWRSWTPREASTETGGDWFQLARFLDQFAENRS